MKRCHKAFLLCLCMLMLCTGCTSKKQPVIKDPFPIKLAKDAQIFSETIGYNTITIFQKDDQVVLNASTISAFFDGAQFTFTAAQPLQASDIRIAWYPIFGDKDEKDNKEIPDKDKMICEILITQNAEPLFSKKINFMQKGLEALDDALEAIDEQ